MFSPDVDNFTETACVVATLRVAVIVEKSVPPSVISVPSTDSVTSGKKSLSLIVISAELSSVATPFIILSISSFNTSSLSPITSSSLAKR